MRIQQGNTARLKVTFSDWDNVPADPDSVQFSITNNAGDVVFDQLLGAANYIYDSDNNRLVGQYFVDYTFNNIGTFECAFVGQLDGSPSLKRIRLQVIKV